jgi:hypothetical protein
MELIGTEHLLAMLAWFAGSVLVIWWIGEW